MTWESAPRFRDEPLVPVGGRFPLSGAQMPVNDEPPSGPTTRPFALRFAREPSRVDTPSLPPHRYCADRQILVTDDLTARPVLGFQTTTLFNKDGKDGPQEDWKPDPPFFHDAS
ncbi:MAG: putative ATP-grasp-modified RiPP [Pseudonocardiaceae bacterium]|nr:putative ATP-grasp-modified RiPP [Pseudonocardiaceae bacterium]